LAFAHQPDNGSQLVSRGDPWAITFPGVLWGHVHMPLAPPHVPAGRGALADRIARGQARWQTQHPCWFVIGAEGPETHSGLALHNQIADNNLLHSGHALGELDGPVPCLFVAHGAAQVDHPASGRHADG